jgi:hypothetical protein
MVASPVAPSRLAANTVANIVASIAARSETALNSSHTPDAAATVTPATPGRSRASMARAAHTTETAKSTAIPYCAMTVPAADPAVPQPKPKLNTAL